MRCDWLWLVIGRFVLVSGRRQDEIKALIREWRRLLEYPHDGEGDEENGRVVFSCQRSSPDPPSTHTHPQTPSATRSSASRCGCHFFTGGNNARAL